MQDLLHDPVRAVSNYNFALSDLAPAVPRSPRSVGLIWQLKGDPWSLLSALAALALLLCGTMAIGRMILAHLQNIEATQPSPVLMSATGAPNVTGRLEASSLNPAAVSTRCTSDSHGAALPTPNGCPWWKGLHRSATQLVQSLYKDSPAWSRRWAATRSVTSRRWSSLAYVELGPRYENKLNKQATVIMYGDSLIEMWKGTREDEPFPPRADFPGVLHEYIGSRWPTQALGSSGDTCLNLEWRLRHGELPSASMSPRVVVVMCGTNDLRDAKIARDSSPARREHQTAAHAVLEAAPEIMKTVTRITELLVTNMPSAQIVMLQLLPRHKAYKSPPLPWDPTNPYFWGLNDINERQAQLASRHEKVMVVNCGQAFLSQNGSLIRFDRMPDGVHPSAEGAADFAKCIASGIETAMGQFR